MGTNSRYFQPFPTAAGGLVEEYQLSQPCAVNHLHRTEIEHHRLRLLHDINDTTAKNDSFIAIYDAPQAMHDCGFTKTANLYAQSQFSFLLLWGRRHDSGLFSLPEAHTSRFSP